MKYTKIYEEIISRASGREIIGHVERHHIVPKCLGGTNKKDNLVRLTYREHFLCHWLLCKIHKDNHKLKSAFAKMLETNKNNSRIVSSRHFDIVKRQIAGTHFKWLKDYMEANGPWNKGKTGLQTPWNKGLKIGPNSIESNTKRSISAKKHWAENEHPRKGKSSWNKGKIGQTSWNKGISLDEHWICEHCGKEGNGHGNYKRWHGDNCKNKSTD
jgi:hypothetical protein